MIQKHPLYEFFLLKFCLDFSIQILLKDLPWNPTHDLVYVLICCHACSHIAMVSQADLFDAKHCCSFWHLLSSLNAFELAEKYKAVFCLPNQCLFFQEFGQILLIMRFRSWKCFLNSQARGTEKGW